MLPLILVVTYRCNLDCTYCPTAKKNKTIDKKIAYNAVDFYFKSQENPQRIKFFGGEPVMEKDILKDIIEYIRKKDQDIKIELTTNGLLLKEGFLDYLFQKNVSVSVSIDGDKKTQISQRKGMTEEDYDDLMKKISPYSSETTLNTVVTPETVDNFFENIRYLHKKGFKNFNLMPAAFIYWSEENIEKLRDQLTLISNFIQLNSDINIKNLNTNSDFILFNSGLVVDTDGSVFFANNNMVNYFQDYLEELKIGTVGCDLFANIKKEKERNKIKEIIESKIDEKILESNRKIDRAITEFVNKIKNTKKRVDIKIGYKCNNNCLFCVQGRKREKLSARNVEGIKEDMKKARKSCNSIVLTGGEPTMHPSFLKIVLFADRLNFDTIQIQTNGRLFAYKEFCKKTVKAGANEFSPAVHGADSEIHDKLTNAKGSFKQTVRGIENLREMNQKVVTNTVITKQNYKQLPEIAKLLVYLDVDQFQFAFPHMLGSAWENRDQVVPRKKDIVPYLKKALDIGIRSQKRVMTEAIPYCLMDGYEDYIAEQVMPDAMIIESAGKIDDYKKVRTEEGKMKREECKKCIYFEVCEGPWREYPEEFGWEEFQPIHKKQ